MKTSYRGIVILLLAMSSACSKAPQPELVGYWELTLNPKQAEKLSRVVHVFSKSEGFDISDKPLEREHRSVTRIWLKRSDGTSIVVMNFLESDKYDITFYKQLTGSKYPQMERALMSAIQTSLGTDVVVVNRSIPAQPPMALQQ